MVALFLENPTDFFGYSIRYMHWFYTDLRWWSYAISIVLYTPNGDTSRETSHDAQRSIPVRLQPLLHDLRVSLLVPSASDDRILHDPEGAIVPAIVLALEELLDLVGRLEIVELLQAHLQEAVEDDHVRAEPRLDGLKVVPDVRPQPETGLGVGGERGAGSMDVLDWDRVEDELQVVGEEGWVLDSSESAEGDFFAVDGGGAEVFGFEELVLGGGAVPDGDAIDSRAEVWVDRGWVATG